MHLLSSFQTYSDIGINFGEKQPLTEQANRQMKRPLSFWQIWNMNFGFLGIQFGWGLQLANMSAIYTKLGAHPDDIPILWLAGPVTGLLVQPVIGAMSDRTWTKLGRRRPYFLTGAILACGQLALDSGCQHQYQHGTFSRFRC
jgi:hypothetical protein